jgi:3-dehydroquinate synthase
MTHDTEPVTVEVRAATRSYPVHIGPGLAARLPELLEARGLAKPWIVVTTPPVWRLHGAAVGGALPEATIIEVPDGERHKTLHTVQRIYDALVRAQAERGSTLVTVGGGVVGDMAGFAAATFMRGIGLVHVPTTLLAQVDASIGGKVGVNLASGKNLVGSFYPPRLVVTDPSFLATLSRREYRAGLYEVIKYGMACSRRLFERLQHELPDAASPTRTAEVTPIVAECCRIKAAIVSEDEREAGRRRILNFGHTVGHAIETLTGYRRFKHGEAVGWGMLAAGLLAADRRLLARADFAALRALIMQLGPLPSVADLPAAQVIDAMRRDKKVSGGRLHFVLPRGIGNADVVGDLTGAEVSAALERAGFQAG